MSVREGTFLLVRGGGVGGEGRGASKGRVISKLYINWRGSNLFYSQPREGHSFFLARKKITSCRLVDSYSLTNTRSV